MITVICPTRGRPERAGAMAASFHDTAALIATALVLVVDADDPTLAEYRTLGETLVVLAPEDTGDLVKATNTVALRVAADGETTIIGHVGDDHLFRTSGWDSRIEAALTEPGVAYGDDLHQGANLPTAVFVSTTIVRDLGWLALPGSTHLYIDNAWKDLGESLGALHYLPDVVIEHMHGSLGKAPMDEGYARASANQPADYAAYLEWRATL